MLEIAIPGGEILRLEYLVADFNGTMACDGVLLPGARDALCRLAEELGIHIVTADTFLERLALNLLGSTLVR